MVCWARTTKDGIRMATHWNSDHHTAEADHSNVLKNVLRSSFIVILAILMAGHHPTPCYPAPPHEVWTFHGLGYVVSKLLAGLYFGRDQLVQHVPLMLYKVLQETLMLLLLALLGSNDCHPGRPPETRALCPHSPPGVVPGGSRAPCLRDGVQIAAPLIQQTMLRLRFCKTIFYLVTQYTQDSTFTLHPVPLMRSPYIPPLDPITSLNL